MPNKVYAPTRSGGADPPTHEFTMIFVRDGVDEPHEFVARPSIGWGDVSSLMLPMMEGASGISAGTLRQIDRLIRRSLVNDDGTPEKWRPRVVTPDDGEPWFTAPNGDHCEVTELPVYEALDAGSSRRRWSHLMEVDDDVTIEPEQILALVNDLMEVASERPTKSSADSSGSPQTGSSAPTSVAASS